jgi:hypothetical protein
MDVGQVPARGEAAWQGLSRGRTWESGTADRARQFAFSVDWAWVGIFVRSADHGRQYIIGTI